MRAITKDTRPLEVVEDGQVRPAFAGPDESHTISKMTATKVECRELGLDPGSRVEEVASYAYTAQEEGTRPQNGVLIEEFSETEEKRPSNLAVNRGVTIVSVSDDESTLRALSRDVSTEDVAQTAEDLPEDRKTPNGDYYDEFYSNGGTPEENHAVRSHRMARIAETIVEERSSEEPSLSQSPAISDVRPAKRIAERSARRGLTRERSSDEIPSPSPRKAAETVLEQPQTPIVESSGLSRETARLEKMEASTALSSGDTSPGRSAQKAKITDDDDEEIDEEMKDLLARVKRQRSALDEILDKETGKESGRIARFRRQSFSKELKKSL